MRRCFKTVARVILLHVDAGLCPRDIGKPVHLEEENSLFPLKESELSISAAFRSKNVLEY